MKKILFSITLTSLLMAASIVGMAETKSPFSSRTASKGLTCPVTKLPISSLSVATGKSVYKGKKYYFCTSHCKELFDKKPQKYAEKK